MLEKPIARPRAAGAASLTSVSDDTNPYSNPVRKIASPAIAAARDDPEAAMIASPPPSTINPAATERRAPNRSANSATLLDDSSSSAPKPAATRPRPPVDTPCASSSHAPDTMNTLMPVAAIAADASIGPQADLGSRSRTVRSAACGVGDPGETNRHASPAAAIAPHSSATYGPRQSNQRINSARIGAPISRANAQDVSNDPIARLRVA